MTAPDPRLKARPCNGADCHAVIAFAITAHGKLIPLNLEPDPAGNVELTDLVNRQFMGTQAFPVAIVHAKGQNDLFGDAGRPRYMPHHATCPNAGDFRGRE